MKLLLILKSFVLFVENTIMWGFVEMFALLASACIAGMMASAGLLVTIPAFFIGGPAAANNPWCIGPVLIICAIGGLLFGHKAIWSIALS